MLSVIEAVLARLPRPLHRLALRSAYRLRGVYRRVARPDLSGVSVIALGDDDAVLLVRHSYGSGAWALPGGGLRSGEDALDCARREMHEELGLPLHQPRLIARQEERLSGTRHTAFLFTARVADAPDPDDREIREARFFALDALPGEMLPLTRKRLAMFRSLREGV